MSVSERFRTRDNFERAPYSPRSRRGNESTVGATLASSPRGSETQGYEDTNRGALVLSRSARSTATRTPGEQSNPRTPLYHTRGSMGVYETGDVNDDLIASLNDALAAERLSHRRTRAALRRTQQALSSLEGGAEIRRVLDTTLVDPDGDEIATLKARNARLEAALLGGGNASDVMSSSAATRALAANERSRNGEGGESETARRLQAATAVVERQGARIRELESQLAAKDAVVAAQVPLPAVLAELIANANHAPVRPPEGAAEIAVLTMRVRELEQELNETRVETIGMESLRADVETAHAEIRMLRSKLATAADPATQAELAVAKEDAMRANMNVSTLEAKIRQLADEVLYTQRDLDSERRQKAEEKRQVHILRAEADSVRTALDEAEARVSALQTALKAKGVTLEAMSAELSQVAEREADTRQKAEVAVEDLKRLRAERDATQRDDASRIARLEAALHDTHIQHESSEARLERVRSDLSTRDRELSEVQRDLDNLQRTSRVAEREAAHELERLRENLADTTSKHMQAVGLAREKDDVIYLRDQSIAALREENTEQGVLIRSGQDRITALDGDLLSVRDAHAASSKRVRELEAKLEEQTGIVARQKISMTEGDRVLAALQASHGDLTNELADRDRTIASLSADVRQLNEDATERTEHIEQLVAEHSKALSTADDNHTSTKQRLSERDSAVVQLTETLDALRAQTAATESELTTRMHRLEIELGTVTNLHSRAVTSIDGLRAELVDRDNMIAKVCASHEELRGEAAAARVAHSKHVAQLQGDFDAMAKRHADMAALLASGAAIGEAGDSRDTMARLYTDLAARDARIAELEARIAAVPVPEGPGAQEVLATEVSALRARGDRWTEERAVLEERAARLARVVGVLQAEALNYVDEEP